jgi:hypothetical protein
VYLPNVLVIRTGQDADNMLSQMEISLGVTPSTDPTWANRPDLERLDRTAKVMEKHWQRLDKACDPNAVFALMYLWTTYGVRAHTRDGYFADNEYLSIITVSFANMYLGAYENWKAGHPELAPIAWRDAFDYAKSGQSSILEDEFLGMNAHINYDLAVAIASLGTTGPDGTTRKVDMDRINHVLADVSDEVNYVIPLYYGPTRPTTEPNWGEGHDASAEAVLEPIMLWREHAWNNAVVLESDTQATRASHDASMQSASHTVALGLQSPKASSPAAERLAYCMANP